MILQNPFYYGAFKFNGELYQGIHKPLVLKKLFDKVQEILKAKSRPQKRGEKFYAFRNLLKCGECNSAITSETQRGHIYYRCTKKKGPCSQKYIREENLAEQISKILQKVSLPSDWVKKMIAELEKDENDKFRADFSFSQNLKSQIKECKDKLDKLLDLQLSGTISSEEYVEKKQKILNQKIEISEKLKDFEKKGNRWLERAKTFILETNQVQIAVQGNNLEEKRDFLKKVGSNIILENQNIKYFPRGAWKILGNLPHFDAEPRSGEAENEAENLKCSSMLRGLDSNQD